ncbi:MAG: trigger factor [Patescibacteria group bacterium]
MDFVKEYAIETLEGSEVKITGEIPFAELEKQRSAAIKHLGKDVQIDGFRPGHVPENVLVEKLGEMHILTEMAERAMAAVYPEVLAAHNIDAIGYPQIQITKIAPDNPLGFTATVAVVPEIKLPDYKSIAKEANGDKESLEVTDEELQKQIEDLLRQKVAYERLQEKAAKQAATETEEKPDLGDTTELPTPESEAKKAEEKAEEEFDPENIELPELTDEYVKTLGQPGQFETVDDFKTKLREHLTIEKEREVTAKHRAKITDNIIEKTELSLPKVLIDSELGQMQAQMNEDLERANLNMADYLKHIKKTEEELKAEWQPAAEKRAKLQLVLNEIAKVEDIKPDEKLLEEQVAQLKEQYKDADESRVKVYVASILQNEAVMKMLEEQ